MSEYEDDLSLVGQTITRVRAFDESPKDEWAHHETFWLWLDDGRVIEFSSYGYDADGATMNEIEVVDVANCLHCHRSHGPTRVFEADRDRSDFGLEANQKYAYCADGNGLSWREPA